MRRDIAVVLAIIVIVTGMLIAGKYLARSGASGQRVSAAGGVKGQPAPDFALQDLQGRTVKLSDLRGKAVLLNFWATWCPPCKVEIPWFVDLQKQYGPQGLEIVGVAMDDAGPEVLAKYSKEMSINYTVLIGNDSVGDAYGGVQALPTTFYIGRDGKLVARVYGLVSHAEVESNVQAALKQGATVAAAGGQ